MPMELSRGVVENSQKSIECGAIFTIVFPVDLSVLNGFQNAEVREVLTQILQQERPLVSRAM